MEPESALSKAEKRFAAEMSNVKDLEEKNVGLNQDVKRAQHELEETRSQAQALRQLWMRAVPSPTLCKHRKGVPP